MTALASKRITREVRFTHKRLAAAASATYFQGAIVGFNTATGLVVRGQPLTTFLPIGVCIEDTTLGAGGGSIDVKLFREVVAYWFANDATDAVVATDIGNLCYIFDDQTVKRDDDTNTLSVAGRVWELHATRGVLVEPVFISVGDLSALDA